MNKIIKNKDNLILFFCLIIQFFLIVLLSYLKDELLYSGFFYDIFYLLGISVIGLIINVFIIKKNINNKNIFLRFMLVIFGLISLFNISYIGKCIKAFRFENNYELVLLTKKYSLNEAKNIKKKIDDIFEYDYDDVFARDVIIGNLYEDDDIFILYLDDIYENYRLKFYLNIVDDEIESIYWILNDNKFYLVKDFKKTSNFEYYYAMNIFNSIRDIEARGLATIEEDVENVIKKEYLKKDIANVIFTYEELNFCEKDNTFSIDVFTHDMNYYGEGNDSSYKVEFAKLDEKNKKKVWYYGDSSFDFVKWTINKK